jgi:aspartate racemase
MAHDTTMLHIGILAHSADGSALCYLEVVRASARRLGAHEHPEITLSLRPMGPTLAAYERGDLAAVRTHLAGSAQRLAAAGCDFFVCPDNTAHLALEQPGEDFLPPGLHIAEVVARQGVRDGRRRIGLLGTKWTMEGSVYRSAMARAGLELRTPPAADRERLNTLIFEELCQGLLSASARADFVRVIGDLAAEGCDAVALGCTEIPLLVTPEVSPLPTLDSTRLLAEAAVAQALSGERPTWRGGPLPRVR